MKRGMVLFLTLVLTAAMAVTTANAQQYVHTDTLTGHTDAVIAIAFKDDGTLISGGGDDTLRAWDVTTGRQRWEKDVGNLVLTVALPSHDPHFIAYGGRINHDIRMRYSEDGDWRGDVSGHTNYVDSLAFKPNSYVLASGSWDNTIRIWDVGDRDNLRHVRTLRGHTESVYSVAWSPDGRTLASASRDGTVRLWNPDNGINFAVLRGHTEGVECVAWSPDGRILASGGGDDTVRIWNPDTHGTRRVLRGHTKSVNTLAFHPNGQTLASGSSDKTIRLWNPNTGALKATLTGYGHTGLAFSPHGQILAGKGPGQNDISLYRLLTVDVTGNGKVNVNDLVEVAKNYGKTVGAGANRKADVNNDGKVDVDDFIAVAEAVDAAGAPALTQEDIEPGSLQASDVRRWIRDAKAANVDPAGIAALERLLAALTRVEAPPKKTVLLSNYPNPFNPETWIPYQLSAAAEVTVTIHSSDGKLVRTLELGQMPAGAYSDKNRAAYWDGRNAQGEPVASGVYFYTLQAGEFSATRKMVIRK
ncbi:hypothetical protein C6495_17275 [Candidatus Poribacteria bacterium]|nr:MAG: hypothetical protein C6495_17275 [Candidatus Poribacteria bacterium]